MPPPPRRNPRARGFAASAANIRPTEPTNADVMAALSRDNDMDDTMPPATTAPPFNYEEAPQQQPPPIPLGRTGLGNIGRIMQARNKRRMMRK